jgi:hypothetical protein
MQLHTGADHLGKVIKHFRERTCTLCLFICFSICIAYYGLLLKVFRSATVPLCDTIVLSRRRLVQSSSIDASI